MPSLQFNKSTWDGLYDWSEAGDEWSNDWGNPYMQWYGSLLPRIHSFLPAGRILEIACGFGRWTEFLKDACNELIALDLSEECINSCKERFSEVNNISYILNDGSSLNMIEDNSIDFIFSFDSLVHADEKILESYIAQFQRILTKNGVVFIHHSNLGEYSYYQKIKKIPKLFAILSLFGIVESQLHWRDPGVTAGKVAKYAEMNGLQCISQEKVPWRVKRILLDCMSIMVRKDSALCQENRILINKAFMQEADNLKKLATQYKFNLNDSI